MRSFFIAFLIGYLAIFILLVSLGGNRFRKINSHAAGFLAALIVSYMVKINYLAAVTTVVAGIGMLVALTWSPYRRASNKPALLAVFSGSLLFADPVVGIVVLAVAFLTMRFRHLKFSLWTAGLVIAAFAALRGNKPDAALLYMLLFYSLVIVRERFFSRSRTKLRLARGILLISVVLLSMTVLYLNHYVYRGFAMQPDLVRAGSNEIPVVALTFDDGPDPRYTPAILDILQEKKVPATFFLVGKHVERYPQIARRIVDEGHEIGNHTYSHANLLGASSFKIRREIEAAEKAIKKATGRRPAYFRPPRGLYSRTLRDILSEKNYALVLWSVSSQDWSGVSAQDIERNVLARVKPGAIILMHDSGDLISSWGGDRTNTVKALPGIIDGLRAQGYRFVSLSELLELSNKPVPVKSGAGGTIDLE
ncbi:polysaccharide deacetylase family protein [Calderihabitans maritimus]|uniref:Polysaccharide deacetylase n=1 Tax=Calderihabitans maritimus TaxID=1246530 RepID=A0A1Z5HX88_9FIRM|nr:polysaccharide deacetylase family protein [Calderihabitans maritimus]GAW94124.1 polysaccharide deacetylase [Calderihabitans maritimus]